mgnify:CR=1 FL=1
MTAVGTRSTVERLVLEEWDLVRIARQMGTDIPEHAKVRVSVTVRAGTKRYTGKPEQGVILTWSAATEPPPTPADDPGRDEWADAAARGDL